MSIKYEVRQRGYKVPMATFSDEMVARAWPMLMKIQVQVDIYENDNGVRTLLTNPEEHPSIRFLTTTQLFERKRK